MTDKKAETQDADLKKVPIALHRAAKRAREIAQRTNTPLVIYRDGRIVKEHLGEKAD